MPNLLDTRVIGRDMADVTTTSYDNAIPGSVLQVGSDGKSMQLGPGGKISELASDSIPNRNGISLQQYLIKQWAEITPQANGFDKLNAIAYGAGMFVAVGEKNSIGHIMYSFVADSVGNPLGQPAWTAIGNHPFDGPIYAIEFADNKWVAVGANGKIGISSNGFASWTLVTVGNQTESLFGVSYGAGKGWVAVGTAGASTASGVTFYSYDALVWQSVNPALVLDSIYGIAYGNGRWVAVGGISSGGNPVNHIATSSDGRTWTQRTTAQPNAAHYKVTYGNGRFVVATNGNTYTTAAVASISGEGWYECYSTAGVYGTGYGNGIWLVAGDGIRASVTGISFNPVYTPPVPWYNGGIPAFSYGMAVTVCYGNGVFLVGRRTGQIYRSGVINEVAAGPQGYQGAQGFQGPAGGGGGGGGAQGAQGAQGFQGIPGNAATAWDAIGSYVLAWYYVGGASAPETPDANGLPTAANYLPAGFQASGDAITQGILYGQALGAVPDPYNKVTGTWRLMGSMGPGEWSGNWARLGLWQKIP